MNLVLLGAPGSGKGTQAKLLTARLGLAHVASGDLFRRHIAQATELGVMAQRYMSRGDLVPDDVTLAMIRDRLQQPDVDRGVLFDGFPRTLPQAVALDDMLGALDRRVDRAIFLSVPDDAIVARLSGRLECSVCQTPFHVQANPFTACPLHKCRGEHLVRRADDDPDTVRRRLGIFHRQTEPVVEYYRQFGRVTTVVGEGDVDAIQREIMVAIDALDAIDARPATAT